MKSTVFTQWEKFAKTSAANGKQLEALNLKLAETLWQKQSALLNGAIETGNRAAALLISGKSYPEIVAEQSKLAGEFFATVLETTRAATEVTASSQAEYRSLFEQGYTDFSKAMCTAYTPTTA